MDIRVEQDDTKLNSPFLPFKRNGALKLEHSIFLSSEGRQASAHNTSFCVLTLQEAIEKEILLFQDTEALLDSWLAEIEAIMKWEASHTEYDTSKIVDEKTE